MSQTNAQQIEIEFEIMAKEPIDPQELADELTEVIKRECPEVVDLKIKVTIEPRPLEKKP